MKCEDCVHYELCSDVSLKKIGIELIPQDECCAFKDRSRFVELPCKLGDTVYYFNSAGEIFSQKVSGFIVNFVGILVDSDVMFYSHMMGDRFFSTREEAEAALKEHETIPNNITPEATIIELNRCKVNGFMPVDVDRRGRAIERAKAALRKQVPMKVGYDDSMSPGFLAVRCGRCTELVEKEYSYCPACGQALDWS